MKHLMLGCEAIVEGALKAGASFYAGYPISPATEILVLTAEHASKHPEFKFVQSEDEIAAANAIMGASLGGAISLMVAMDRPDIFGNCGSQSGAFEVDEGRLLTMVEQNPAKPVAVYLDCGTFGDLTAENRSMNGLLAAKGYMVMYQEFNEGHSWGNWRAHVDDMLVFFWGKEGEAK